MKCQQCECDFLEKGKQKFCSRSCAATFNNKRFIKRKKEAIFCLMCNEKLNWSQKKFCSYECSGEYNSTVVTKEKIERGLCTESSTLKIYLKRSTGNFCYVCKALPIHNGKELKMELDHIDGDSDNNLPSNLRLVCPNCHSQSATSVGGPTNRKNSKRSKMNLLRRKEFLHLVVN